MTDPDPNPSPPPGLSELSGVTLDEEHRQVATLAHRGCAGTAEWQAWKRHSLHDFLALAQVSGRIITIMANLIGPLRLVFRMQVPVPTLPDPDGDLVIGDHAVLGLNYEEAALHGRVNGASFMMVLEPACVWLPNVAPADGGLNGFGLGQALCLGAVAAGIEVKELILQSYSALAMQTMQRDPHHPAGVMNIEAARWFQDPHNSRHIPLTPRGILEAPTPSTP